MQSKIACQQTVQDKKTQTFEQVSTGIKITKMYK